MTDPLAEFNRSGRGHETAPRLLIAVRAAQGFGAAVIMALTVALVGEIVPKGKTGSAMGLLGTMSAIGTTFGPGFGGLLIAGFGWRTIFLVNVPLGVLNFLLAYRHLPVGRREAKTDGAGFDKVGTLLLALTLAAYALAMTTGHGRPCTLNMALLSAAVFGVGLFILAERGASSSLIRLSTPSRSPSRSELTAAHRAIGHMLRKQGYVAQTESSSYGSSSRLRKGLQKRPFGSSRRR